MKKIVKIIGLVLLVTIFSNCAGTSKYASNKHQTIVRLSSKTYKIKKLNAVGESDGFAFGGPTTYQMLGMMVPLSGLEKSEAFDNLYRDANVKEGESVALMYLCEQVGGLDFIAFSFPKIKLRADVIEFTK